ncbi:hypothetical protein D5F52_04745 [Brevibacillus laterosporus]|nr:hypothetical protein D5F52_04745 [Brevibacillus laterosporus]MBM7110894.1 hypothetical protein [Brevibacillus laterosporus]
MIFKSEKTMLISIVVTLILIGAILLTIIVHRGNNLKESCIKKDGEYHYFRSGSLCIKQNSIIEIE